ncbi:MAG: hypothetical protein M1561_01430 [Gammaproteobacteria bacterium]|nr:hypothetical protein [Gammaproteobacteria bacterium]
MQQMVATGLRKDIAGIENATQILPYDANYFTTLTTKATDAVQRYKEQCKILEANNKLEGNINKQKRSRIWYLFTAVCGGLGGVELIGILFSPELVAGLGNISFVVGLPLAVLGITVAVFAKKASWSNKERSIVAISCFALGVFGGVSVVPQLAEVITAFAPWLVIAAIFVSVVVTRNTYTHNDELEERLREEMGANYNSIQNISTAKKGLGDRQIDNALAFSGNTVVQEQHNQVEAVSLLADSIAATSFGLSQSIAKSSGNTFLYDFYDDGDEKQQSSKLD